MIEDMPAIRVVFARVAHEGQRSGGGAGEFAREEAIIERGEPVDIRESRFLKPAGVMAGVVEDDEVKWFLAGVTQDGLQRLGEVVGVADEQHARAFHLGQPAWETATGGVGLDHYDLGFLRGGQLGDDGVDVERAGGGAQSLHPTRGLAGVGVWTAEDLVRGKNRLPVGVLVRQEKQESVRRGQDGRGEVFAHGVGGAGK